MIIITVIILCFVINLCMFNSYVVQACTSELMRKVTHETGKRTLKYVYMQLCHVLSLNTFYRMGKKGLWQHNVVCEAVTARFQRCHCKGHMNSMKASSWIGEPSKENILKVEERINHMGRHFISNLKWLTAVSGAAINAYRSNSIGFKLGHTVIKSAKLVEGSLTAVCLCQESTVAAV